MRLAMSDIWPTLMVYTKAGSEAAIKKRVGRLLRLNKRTPSGLRQAFLRIERRERHKFRMMIADLQDHWDDIQWDNQEGDQDGMEVNQGRPA